MQNKDPAPIALFAYNRPYHTKKTLESLIKNNLASKSFIYVFIDGVKNSKDIKKNISVKEIVKSFSSSFKSMEIIHNESNKGLADNIVEGINFIFKQYEKIIVLEDDIEVSPVFLKFMNEALDKYESEKKVWHISAYIQPFFYKGEKTRFFWKYMHCWGWGTWKSRWKYYLKDPRFLLRNLSSSQIKSFNLGGIISDWNQVILNDKKQINTWAIFWYATIFLNKGLSLYPTKSLSRNIGHDNSGEHCGENINLVKQKIESKIDSKYPSQIEEDKGIKILVEHAIKERFRLIKKFIFFIETFIPLGNYSIKLLRKTKNFLSDKE